MTTLYQHINTSSAAYRSRTIRVDHLFMTHARSPEARSAYQSAKINKAWRQKNASCWISELQRAVSLSARTCSHLAVVFGSCSFGCVCEEKKHRRPQGGNGNVRCKHKHEMCHLQIWDEFILKSIDTNTFRNRDVIYFRESRYFWSIDASCNTSLEAAFVNRMSSESDWGQTSLGSSAVGAYSSEAAKSSSSKAEDISSIRSSELEL